VIGLEDVGHPRGDVERDLDELQTRLIVRDSTAAPRISTVSASGANPA
jgi:hypothetical protein